MTTETTEKKPRKSRAQRAEATHAESIAVPHVTDAHEPASEQRVIAQESGNGWAIYNADSCALLADPRIPEGSVGHCLFSPPFSDLYVYSPSDNDMGNATSDDGFIEHFGYLARNLYRIMMPGRIVAIHCWDHPMMKSKHGEIGFMDFPGMLIQAMRRAGFIPHSRTTVWKDPVVAMQRSKALGLLHKQVRTDSAMSRSTFADYLIAFRKPGKNPRPIVHEADKLARLVDGKPVTWQEYAQCLWSVPGMPDGSMAVPLVAWASAEGVYEDGVVSYGNPRAGNSDKRGIDQGDTLQVTSVRQAEDEKHMCPLQLEFIRRCLELWSAPGDVVLTPFLGIGSELYAAVQMGRMGIGVELKPEYFAQAAANLRAVEPGAKGQTLSLFGLDVLNPDGAALIKVPGRRGKR